MEMQTLLLVLIRELLHYYKNDNGNFVFNQGPNAFKGLTTGGLNFSLTFVNLDEDEMPN